MDDGGVGSNDRTPAGSACAETKVDIFTIHKIALVEASELFKYFALDKEKASSDDAN
jgi:hypothetical protein